MTVVLVPGTWANTSRNVPKDEWWKPGSPFCEEATRHGLRCLSFAWNTRLDGVLGKNADWMAAAEILYRQVKDLQPVTMIAHSHGGQLPLLATEHGLEIGTLVTVATPVREDVLSHLIGHRIHRWVHIYTGAGDQMQLLGEIGDGEINARRKMPGAENVYEPDQTHSGLMEADLWNARRWWEFLK